MNRILLGLGIGAVLLAGCSTNKYCERSERRYEHVVESAPLKAPDGLSVPKPDPNLAVPSATGPQVSFATQTTAVDKKGKTSKRTNCLDAPPPLPPPAGTGDAKAKTSS